jgi:predicted O-methyltransferase YrrM
VTRGGSAIPEVHRLLTVLAAGKRVAEAGTAFGEGAEAMARTASSVVTVEIDPDRAEIAAKRLRGLANVELLTGDWLLLLPERRPFDLVFLDGGGFKQEPYDNGSEAIALLAPHGLLVVDDLTPGYGGHDAAREFLFGHRELVAVEILTTVETAAIVAARS